MKRLLLTLAVFLAIPLLSFGKDPIRDSTKTRKHVKDTLEFSAEYLDTVKLAKAKKINDYSLLGVEYGITMAGFTYSPSKGFCKAFFVPNHIGIMYTHYEKLFGRIANFAFMTGIDYTHEGFTFECDEATGRYLNDLDKATKAVIDLVEVPAMFGVHVDVAVLKFQAMCGIYGGYRKSIEREGPTLEEQFKHSFHDYEYRFDYGLRGGAGFALMFDPIEIHFNTMVRWGWQSLYQPDYSSKYYYYYAYPLDLTFTAGIHFQLTKRKGKSNRALRTEAKEIVYGKAENSDGTNRQ